MYISKICMTSMIHCRRYVCMEVIWLLFSKMLEARFQLQDFWRFSAGHTPHHAFDFIDCVLGSCKYHSLSCEEVRTKADALHDGFQKSLTSRCMIMYRHRFRLSIKDFAAVDLPYFWADSTVMITDDVSYGVAFKFDIIATASRPIMPASGRNGLRCTAAIECHISMFISDNTLESRFPPWRLKVLPIPELDCFNGFHYITYEDILFLAVCQ